MHSNHEAKNPVAEGPKPQILELPLHHLYFAFRENMSFASSELKDHICVKLKEN